MGMDARKDRLRPLGITVRGRPSDADSTAPTPAELEVEAAVARRRRPRLLPLIALAGLCLLLVQVTPSSGSQTGEAEAAPAPDRFVTADGAELAADGAPWTPVGFNDYRLTSAPDGYVCDPEGGALDDEQLGERLDRVRDLGGNVVRTWFFSSYVNPDSESEWSAFERVVAAAEQRGLRVIGVLGNHWEDCEGGSPEKDLSFYSGGYRRSPGEGRSYLEHATAVAEHFSGSPAIAFWQLLNEPEAPGPMGCDPAAAADALAGFATEAATAVRGADPNHLVSLGVIGGEQCGVAGSAYGEIQTAVDLCELHSYDSAENGTDPADPLPAAAAARIAACESAGKPIVAGEVGFAADLGATGEPTGSVDPGTLANRAGFLDARIEAMTAAGLDGFLVWQLSAGTPEIASGDPYGVGPCDPIEAVVASRSEAPGTAAGCEVDEAASAGVGS